MRTWVEAGRWAYVSQYLGLEWVDFMLVNPHQFPPGWAELVWC